MTSAAKKPAPSPTDSSNNEGIRETIESIAIAFVLAFLFRTFEAEAFVIPTGSMAPTLMGRHYDLDCPQCKHSLRVGASEENDDRPNGGVGLSMRKCICPNCRYELDVTPDGRDGPIAPSYNGDRIIVSKFPYEFGDPRRWDVAVFRYPATAKINYIKRIVGLPGETVRIEHGDVSVRKQGQPQFETARKPPHKVMAIMQLVYDEDHRVPWIEERGWPSRWSGDGTPEGFQRVDNPHAFGNQGGAALSWLRYRHWVPMPAYWAVLRDGPLSAQTRQATLQRGPYLISDFSDYNTRGMGDYEKDFLGRHWVGDLVLECELKVDGKQGDVVLELIEGGRAHQCWINLETGAARLLIAGLESFQPQATTSVRGQGTYQVRFANVDDQLLLWINDKLVTFSTPTTFGPLPFSPPQPIGNDHPGDWSPVGIAARGAKVKVDHLRIHRDVYYIAPKITWGLIAEYDERADLPEFFVQGQGQFPAVTSVEFELKDDQFFALGDNSPKSKDSRLWTARDPSGNQEYYVQREMLIGKAMFVYWPHGWAPDWAVEMNVFGLRVRLPFYPNLGRMRFIH